MLRFQSSYISGAIKVGQVKAIDLDGDSSSYGKIMYSFVNQSSKTTLSVIFKK